MAESKQCPKCKGREVVEIDKTNVWRCLKCGAMLWSSPKGLYPAPGN
jgi:ribosomal protein L37AE/L43A